MKKWLWICPLMAMLSSCANVEKKQEVASAFERTWWKEGILYQIYPQSFRDTDGDGFGDFKGVIEKLDYIESLGITMVWMNPFFQSPLVDNGYDVSDYRAIHPRYGNMEDFEEMLEGFHQRGIKFVLDVVVNHSSEAHEWFQQAQSSRTNPYRDYYHWWPTEKGVPPTDIACLTPRVPRNTTPQRMPIICTLLPKNNPT